MIDKSYYYIIIAALIGGAALVLIPKDRYKKYLLYGLLFGGLGDTIIVTLFSKIFPLFQYKNMGVFNVLGLFSIWTPITWTFVFAIYFYLLPVRKVFLVPYVLTFIGFNVAMGMVMSALGLFEYHKPYYQYLDLIDFFAWFIIAAWIYIKAERIELK